MRYAILGDIHGNIEALDAVLEPLRREKIDTYYSVGDIVGYGADPLAVIDRLKEIDCKIVAGNHDHAAVGLMDETYFNPYAKDALIWTRKTLRAPDNELLRTLPMSIETDTFQIVHASPFNAEEFPYVQTLHDARNALASQARPVCFIGHSHIPVSFFLKGEDLTYAIDPVTPVDKGEAVLVNVGSVGQPRDHDPRAVYAIYDTEAAEVRLHRVPYDHEETGRKILAAGLHPILAERLKYGR